MCCGHPCAFFYYIAKARVQKLSPPVNRQEAASKRCQKDGEREGATACFPEKQSFLKTNVGRCFHFPHGGKDSPRHQKGHTGEGAGAFLFELTPPWASGKVSRTGFVAFSRARPSSVFSFFKVRGGSGLSSLCFWFPLPFRRWRAGSLLHPSFSCRHRVLNAFDKHQLCRCKSL